MSLCDPTRMKLLVRTALGPPGLATTKERKIITAYEAYTNEFYTSRLVYLF